MAALVVATGAAAPASAATDAEPQAAAGQEVTAVSAAPDAVIALGDSYSSGLGAGDYQDDCDRTPRAWGNIIFGEAVTDRTLLACSGAQIPEVRAQIEQLAELPGESGGRLITLTVGGNDVGFADELINCLTPFVSCLDREAVITQRIDALHDPLVDVYTSIQAAAPGDEVIVGGYPMLVPDPAVRSDCAALTGLLSTAERQMIRRLGVALNDAIDAAASAAGVRSAATELEQGFDGHEACANGADDWLYGLKISWPWAAADGSTAGPGPSASYEQQWEVVAGFVSNSFHPTVAGQSGYAAAFEQVWLNG
ncbi:SGNH/GDSL hydrolase family protein [Haloactinopolyspora sp.]|uniref:SGNH/GDSL hydrolase family protein n=1 Tax=Haloactinopolyspora sp. TaxID=1966353 RepID=UPI00260318E0|nr:SGNH/GDSL hydrolase family protein [Haloactinopolyspora sp.]